MILADKITELRKKNGWSQEELAEKAGVTRQSVSKWESAQSQPDLDKIIKLAEIFGVTTDYLLRDENETAAATEEKYGKTVKDADESQNGDIRQVTTDEAEEFLRFKEKSAKKIAMGVSMCILSPVILILLSGAAEYGVIGYSEDKMAMLGVIVMLAVVALAVARFFIPEGIASSRYEYLEKDFLFMEKDTREKISAVRDEFQPEFGRKIAVSVFMLIVSVMPIFVLGVIFDTEEGFHFVAAVAIMFFIAAFAVNIIVKAGMKWETFQKLLEEGDYSREKKDKVRQSISAVYWLTVTAIYLVYSFITSNWHTSWIIWPVAAVAYVILGAVYDTVKKE